MGFNPLTSANVTLAGDIVGTLTATSIATGSIVATHLVDGAVTLPKMGTSDKASLRNRATHSGTQDIATIVGLQTVIDDKAGLEHAHTTSDVSGLDTILSTKASNTYFVPIVVRAVGSTTVPSGFPTGGIVFTRQS